MASLKDRVRALFGRKDDIPLPTPNYPSPSTPEERQRDSLEALGILRDGWTPINSAAIRKMKFVPYGQQYDLIPAGTKSPLLQRILKLYPKQKITNTELGDVLVVYVKTPGKEYLFPRVPRIRYIEGVHAASKGRWVEYYLKPMYSINRGRGRTYYRR